MKTYFVVTGIVKKRDRLLILKKAADDRNYPNKWGFCSGFVKEFEAAEDTCLREIKEETGLKAKIIKTGKIVEVIDEENAKKWVIAAYLCETETNDVHLCRENTDYNWVSLEDLNHYDFVPGFNSSESIL